MTLIEERPNEKVVPIRPGLALMRTLVVGAGVAGRALARDLAAAPEYGLQPVGFLDDDPDLTQALPLPVLGRLDELTSIALAVRAEAVVLAIPRLSNERFRDLVSRATAAGVAVRYLPSFVAALEREVGGSDVRWLDVARLLGRDEIHVVSPEAGAEIHGRTVLVTGAGGSIGSELCRQVFGFGPKRLVLLDHDESNLHRLELELYGDGTLDNDDCIVADIRDARRIEQLFADIQPDLVFHAAAHKHLPLLERHPCEAVKSNVRGTENVLWAAIKHEVDKFILISTDKAADPSSVLGATKRLAEMLVQQEVGGRTKLAAVRFGNVLGSRGSLLSVLAEQLRSGIPMTITHPDMERFFMTIEEAAGLVIEASRLADCGEVFVLDMGEPVRILDVAQSFAALMHRPDSEIRFTGMREGEKLNECLFGEHEDREPTVHPRIYRTSAGEHPPGFERRLRSLYDAAWRNDPEAVRVYLRSLLPEYRPAVPKIPAQVAPYADDY
ncbi:MAG TPA: nucleoside-diphosphate sugar epimerase/dehydratase [Nocardioidaceae bacterium]|nr:nucleoside-diphosphate sugar epimerase/dehydratase [Nocardioidaceae bacterium]